MSGEKLDVVEVKVIIDNLQYLEKQLPLAITRWRKHINTCDLAVGHMSKGVLRRLCENPAILKIEVFGPLYSFLNTYVANREGRIAFTGKALDAFLNRGLVALQKYTVISDFFARNPQYLVPDVPISQGYQSSKRAITEQNKYKDFIFTLNERLIGCKQNLNFVFLQLLTTIKNMSPDQQQMKTYLEQQCTFMRVERLKM